MKKILIAILVLTLALSSFAGCGNNEDEKKVLTVYTDPAFQPFEYYEGKDIVGIDMKIAQLIADELGADLKIEVAKFEAILPSLENNEFSIAAAGLSITPDRLLEADFSTPYFEGGMGIIFKKDQFVSGANIAYSEIEGKKIGVQISSAGYTQSKAAGLETVVYGNALIAAQDIGGGCDYVVVDFATAKAIAEGAEDLGLDYATVGDVKESYGIATKKGNTELMEAVNKVIKELNDSDQVYTWYDEYLNA